MILRIQKCLLRSILPHAATGRRGVCFVSHDAGASLNRTYGAGVWNRPNHADLPMTWPSIALIKSSRVVSAGKSSLVSRAKNSNT